MAGNQNSGIRSSGKRDSSQSGNSQNSEFFSVIGKKGGQASRGGGRGRGR